MTLKKFALLFGAAILHAFFLVGPASAQGNNGQGAINTYQINRTFFVAQAGGFLPTIQSAVTAACATVGGTVNIQAGISPPDTIAAVTGGCTTVGIVDQRVIPSVSYSWNGSAYIAASSGGGAVSSLTTTGSSGAATLASGVLNIPQYTDAGTTQAQNSFLGGPCTGGPGAATWRLFCSGDIPASLKSGTGTKLMSFSGASPTAADVIISNTSGDAVDSGILFSTIPTINANQTWSGIQSYRNNMALTQLAVNSVGNNFGSPILSFTASLCASTCGGSSNDLWNAGIVAGTGFNPSSIFAITPMSTLTTGVHKVNIPAGSSEGGTFTGGVLTGDSPILTAATGAAISEPIGAAAQTTANAAAVKSNNLSDLTSINVARTNLGITALPSGAIAEYRFNEGTGTTVTDYSGNGNNGTFATSTHAPTWNTLTGLNVSQASEQYVTLPAALNAAKTIIVIAQFNQTSASIPETVVGSSTAAGANGFNFNLSGLNSIVVGQQNNAAFIYVNNSPVGSSQQVINTGIQMLSYEIDSTGNAVYANTSLVAGTFGTTSTTPTTGTYQIGCGSIVATWCLDGTLYGAVFYPTKLTAAQISQAFSALSQTLLSRGISMTGAVTPLSVLGTASPLVFKGTSITLGSTNGATPWVNQLVMNTNDGWTVSNLGQGGETLAAMLQQEQQVDQLFVAQSPLATTMIEGGTNDLCLSTPAPTIWPTFNALRQYIRRRKATGWRVIVAPMLPRGNNAGCDAIANLYNAQIRAQWKVMGADAFVDYAADPLLGANGAWSNATYYSSIDLTHPTTAGNALIATYVSNTLAGMDSSSSSANPTLATTTYQMLPADWFVRGNPTAGAFTITLPVCAGMTGTERLVKNSGTANNLTLAGSGSDLIDGASSITIAPAASVQLMDVLTSTTAAGCHWEQVN